MMLDRPDAGAEIESSCDERVRCLPIVRAVSELEG
jgi:hypothetical protein